jgi:hypothetical protein
MKETGLAHWKSPNRTTNSSGFRSSGGYRDGNGAFNSIGSNGNWWSSTVVLRAWYRVLFYTALLCRTNSIRLSVSQLPQGLIPLSFDSLTL